MSTLASLAVNDPGLVAPAAALAIGLTGLGAAIGQGRAVASALEGLARNPHATTVRGTMILGLGMIESVLVLVVVMLLTKM
jgi:F-type H+-transporting ATPase subunit c